MADNDIDRLSSFEEKMDQFLAQEKVEKLTPIQTAFLRLAWAAFGTLAVCLIIIVFVWRSQLPPVPPLTAKPDEVEQYRTLLELANESLKTSIENIVTLVLYPALTLFTGYVFGKRSAPKD